MLEKGFLTSFSVYVTCCSFHCFLLLLLLCNLIFLGTILIFIASGTDGSSFSLQHRSQDSFAAQLTNVEPPKLVVSLLPTY